MAAGVLAAALAIAGRFWLLATRPLWNDEIFTIWISRLTPSGILETLENDSGPPLFYFLEKPVVAAAETLGWPDNTARALPFLAALLLFAAAWTLPRGLPRAAFLLLAAASPLCLLYAGEARAYALLAAADLFLFLLVLRGRTGWGSFAAIAAAASLVLATHYLAIFFVGALLLACLAAGRVRAAAALAIGGLASLPVLSLLFVQPLEATAWMRERVGPSALRFLSTLGGWGRIPAPFGPPLPPILLWLGAGAGAALLLVFLFLPRGDAELRIGALAVVLTLLSVLAASFFPPAAYSGRTEMAVLGVWIWLVARRCEVSRSARWIAAAAIAIGALSCTLVAVRAPRLPFMQDALFSRASAIVGPADTLVASGTFVSRARLASDRGRLRGRLLTFPSDLGRHPGWFVPRPPAEKDYAILSGQLARAPGRLFLLLDAPYFNERLKDLLDSRGEVQTIAAPPRALLLLSTPR